MSSQFDTPLSEAVQVLKQVLPLMTEHKVPTIPPNYAVWYDYVTRNNADLQEELDEILQESKPFSAELCASIYQRYFMDELNERVSGLQESVRVAVSSVLSELGGLGNDMAHFSDVLDDCGTKLQDDLSPEALQGLVMRLADETKVAHTRSQEVEGSLHSMASELTELRSQVNQLSRDSLTDALTQVSNRRAFNESLARMSAEATADNSPLCLILADIDHFKAFNDTHGHLVGDIVLREVAQEMKQCVKGRDMLARYGGEEFAILLPATPLTGAKMLAESIRTIVESERLSDDAGNRLEPVTVSMGVAQLKPGESTDSLIERADSCLYQSKETGRNRVTGEDALTRVH